LKFDEKSSVAWSTMTRGKNNIMKCLTVHTHTLDDWWMWTYSKTSLSCNQLYILLLPFIELHSLEFVMREYILLWKTRLNCNDIRKTYQVQTKYCQKHILQEEEERETLRFEIQICHWATFKTCRIIIQLLPPLCGK
jgi:hypothetical protein